MKVTVTEALRIKKEIASKVSETQSAASLIKWATSEENGKPTGMIEGAITFEEFTAAINKLFAMSETINSVLAKFNVESGISDAVRKKANFEYLIQVYRMALSNSEPKNNVAYQVVGNNRVAVNVVWKPILNKSKLKESINEIKKLIRELQTFIDTKNAEMIELPFEYADFENIILK